MTISKKLSISIITTLALVGMLAFTTPTHAGFFDWLFGKNVEQEANVLKATQSMKAETTVKKDSTKTVEVACDSGSVTVNNVPAAAEPNADYWCKRGGGTWSVGVPEQEDGYNPKPTITTYTASKTDVTTRVPVTTLRPGVANANVVALQKRLAEAGYYAGSVTGTYDLATQKAVIEFQKARRLQADGIAGVNTITSLNANLASQVTPPVGGNGSMNDECLIVTHVSAQNSSTVWTTNSSEPDLGRFIIQNDCGDEIILESIDFEVLSKFNTPHFDEVYMKETLGNSIFAEEDEVTVNPGWNGAPGELDFSFYLENGNGYELEDGESIDFSVIADNVFNGVASYNIATDLSFVIGIEDIDYVDAQTNQGFSYGESEWGDVIRLKI